MTTITFHDAAIRSQSQDHLNRDPVARALHALIKRAPVADAALVLGIFGPWGSGKSSVMQLLSSRITADQTGPVLWFEAWRYARQDEELWRALLLALVEGLRADTDLRQALSVEGEEKVKAFDTELDNLVSRLYRSVELTVARHLSVNWKALLPVAARAGLHMSGLGLLGPLLTAGKDAVDAAEKKSGEGEDAKALGDLLQRTAEKEYRAQITALEQFQQEIRSLVKVWVTNRGQRLTVFVDDLDRCTPDAAVGALEAIKLFLDTPGTVFVLGLHRDAIEAGVAERYPALKDTDEVKRYLDKIIQIPVTLPEPGDIALSTFVAHWAEAFAPDMPAACRRIILTGADPNPRMLRRILSAYLLSSLMHESKSDADFLARLSKLAVLQIKAPALFAAAEKDVRYLQRLERVAGGQTVNGLNPVPDDPRLLSMLKDSNGLFGAIDHGKLEELVKLTALTG